MVDSNMGLCRAGAFTLPVRHTNDVCDVAYAIASRWVGDTTIGTWRGIKLTLTKPSGATEVLGGATGFTTDSTGSTYTSYIPDEIGNWTVRVDFPGQVYGVNPPFSVGNIQSYAFYNDTFQARSFTTTFSVQQEALQNETFALATSNRVLDPTNRGTEYRMVSNCVKLA